MNGGSENVGSIKYDARIDTSTLKSSASQAESIVKSSADKSQSAVSKSASGMKSSLDTVPGSVVAIGASYLSIQGLTGFLRESVSEANRFQASMLGLNTIANAFGQSSTGAREAARQLAADGLMPLQDAATSLKNLLATGFSLDEAITLISRFKDSAAFGRQSALEFGESIRGATEGIKNGNSILVDNAGVTKNLSVILQEAGKSQQDVMNITSDASVRQALYTGLLKETNAQLGDSAKLAQTAAGSDAALTTQMTNLHVQIGQVANAIRQPLVQGMTSFIQSNQQAIISVGTGVVAFAAFAGGAYLAVKAIALLRVGLTLLMKHPAIAVIGVLFGVFAGAVMDKMISNMASAGDGMEDFGGATGGAADQVNGLSKEAKALAKQLAQIDDQILKTNRDFNESLAQMVQDHQKTIKDITKQIQDEGASYKKAYEERLSKFSEEQDEETQAHQEKVTKLQTQIDFLRRYQNASNRQQLSELQFALARENGAYETKMNERRLKYDKDAAAEKASYDERTLELQNKLNAENEILTKHAADVASIRNVTLLDEIDKLKRGRDEQLASLNQQKIDALSNASQTASGVGSTYGNMANNLKNSMGDVGNSIGSNMGNAFKDALKTTMRDMFQNLGRELFPAIDKFFYDMGTRMGEKGGFTGPMRDSLNAFAQPMAKSIANAFGGNRAMGGPVSSGTAYAVGDNPDGSWNKTTELFVPNRSGTIIPSGDLQKMVGSGSGGGGTNVSINVSMSGIMSSSAADERTIAKRLIGRVNEELRAKGLPELGVAA